MLHGAVVQLRRSVWGVPPRGGLPRIGSMTAARACA